MRVHQLTSGVRAYSRETTPFLSLTLFFSLEHRERERESSQRRVGHYLPIALQVSRSSVGQKARQSRRTGEEAAYVLARGSTGSSGSRVRAKEPARDKECSAQHRSGESSDHFSREPSQAVPVALH